MKKEHSEENKNSTDLLEDQFKKLFWKAEQKNKETGMRGEKTKQGGPTTNRNSRKK